MHSYQEYKEIIEKYLTDYISKPDIKSITLYDAAKYSLLAGGKRLRPVLLLAACEYKNSDLYEALPLACAIEYIHTYSLIHDDLPAMDNDDLRRGNPTNHKVYGEDVAILAGDALLNSAYETLIRNMTYYFDDEEKLKNHINASLVITKNAGITGMIAGQMADIENVNNESSKDMVEFINRKKTGDLIVAPIIAGLFIGGASKDEMDKFTIYGESIGSAFQIADDILDYIGTQEKIGKRVLKDKENGKCNYVYFHGLEEAKNDILKLTEKATESIKTLGTDVDFFVELANNLMHREF